MSFNPLAALRAAADTGFSQDPMGSSLTVPWAKNFFDFVSGAMFLNMPSVFPRQAVIGSIAADEVCYHCSSLRWIESWFTAGYDGANYKYETKYIGNGSERQHKIVLLERGICGKCKRSRWDLTQEGYMEGCREFVTMVGQRSGKSAFTGGMLAPYWLHRMLEHGSPSKAYGILEGNELQYTMVAPSLEVAKETLWSYFTGSFYSSVWFRNFNDQVAEMGLQRGEKWVILDKTRVIYPKHGIRVNIAAADPAKLRGRTRFGVSVDELSWMSVDPAAKLNAGEIVQALKASLQTINQARDARFGPNNFNLLPAMMANCSSPKHTQDQSMQLFREYERASKGRSFPFSTQPDEEPCPDEEVNETKIVGIGTRRVGIHTPTHNFNPRVTWEALLKEYPGQLQKLIRDFGARPPQTLDPLFEVESDVWDLTGDYRNVMKLESKLQQINGVVYNVPQRVMLDFEGIEHPCVLTIDLGEVLNGCGFTVVEILPKGKCRLRGTVSIYPVDNHSIHFPSIYERVIEPILQEPIIGAVAFDRWNSTQMAQQIHTEYGLDVKKVNMKAVTMEQFVTMVSMKQIELPRLEDPIVEGIDEWTLEEIGSVAQEELQDCPVSLLVKQMLTVRKVGKKFLKPAVGDDDLFRALVLGASYAMDPETYNELLLQVGRQFQQAPSRPQSRTRGLPQSSGARTTRAAVRQGLEWKRDISKRTAVRAAGRSGPGRGASQGFSNTGSGSGFFSRSYSKGKGSTGPKLDARGKRKKLTDD